MTLATDLAVAHSLKKPVVPGKSLSPTTSKASNSEMRDAPALTVKDGTDGAA